MSHDIAVIGGGPAGLSAAINARVRNKTVLVVGAESLSNLVDWKDRITGKVLCTGRSG